MEINLTQLECRGYHTVLSSAPNGDDILIISGTGTPSQELRELVRYLVQSKDYTETETDVIYHSMNAGMLEIDIKRCTKA